MRRVDLLINSSREETESENFSPDTGIQDTEFLQYLNDAQDRIYAAVLSVYPNEFQNEKIITCTAGTALVSLPADTYLGSKVKFIEYSANGQDSNYYKLEKGVTRERVNGYSGDPSFYIRRGSKILLNPAPSTNGTLRVTYFQKLPKLDKRRGKVGSVVLNTTNNTITSLVIDLTTMPIDDIEAIQDDGYMTLVDKDGNIQMQGIPVSMIDPNTGLLTLDGTFNFESGETASAGNWVLMGKRSTSHSFLDDSCERYLLQHCNWKILKRDSSNDSVESNDELTALVNEIVSAYKDADEDVDFITVLDTDYLSF